MYDCAGCGRRTREGLFFGSGQEAKWWCPRCQSADQKKLVSSLDDRSREVLTRDADGVDWPYGPNVYVWMRLDLLNWADRYDLRSGSTGCSSGVHWLDKGRCSKSDCHSPGFYDHTTTWLSRTTGRPVLVFTQPYNRVDTADIWKLISEYPSLRAEVGPDGWYGSGTVGVYIWNDSNRADAGRPRR